MITTVFIKIIDAKLGIIFESLIDEG